MPKARTNTPTQQISTSLKGDDGFTVNVTITGWSFDVAYEAYA